MILDPRKLTLPAGVVAALLVGAFSALGWADARYASADSVQRLSGKIDEARAQQLEDRIFELLLVERRSPAQQAMLERYRSQLEALQKGKK